MSETTIFAIAYAGGSARATYSKWAPHLGKLAELIPLEYAGHGHRMGESFHQSLDDIVIDMMRIIRPIIKNGKPYVFYGHSMGCAVVYELVRRIASESINPPKALFLSARRPPDALPTTSYHTMSDEEFLDEIKGIGGTPSRFFELQELVNAFLPVLRNDYNIIEKYRMQPPPHVTSADIHFFLSDNDDMVSESTVQGWSDYTDGSFHLYNYQGGHFFINESYPQICKTIVQHFVAKYSPIIA